MGSERCRNQCTIYVHLLRNQSSCISLLWELLGLPRATIGAPFANQQILGFHCFGATGATIGAPFANQQILEFLAMQSLLCIHCYWSNFYTFFHFRKSIYFDIFLYTLFTNRSIWTIFRISLIFWIPYHRGPLCQPANP